MKIRENNNVFKDLKRDSENKTLSENHLSLFEDKLNQNFNNNIGKSKWFSIPMAAVLILGLVLTGIVTIGKGNYSNVDLKEYKTTKSYFVSYVEYELGIQKEKITPENKNIIESSLKAVSHLQEDYKTIEDEFLKQHYDKQILKRMIENFRKQLDILENIDLLLEESIPNQTKTYKDEKYSI